MDGRGFLEVFPVGSFFSLGSWPFGFTSSCLKVLLPLKCVWIPYLPQIFLKLSTVIGCKGWQCVQCWVFPGGLPPLLPLGLWVLCTGLPSWLLLVLLLSSQLLLIYLFWTLCMACPGYLHLPKASLRCCISLWKSSGAVQTVLVLEWGYLPHYT